MLSLRDNQIVSLPTEFGYLHDLSVLNLVGNRYDVEMLENRVSLHSINCMIIITELGLEKDLTFI